MIEYRPFQMPCLNLRCYFGIVGDNCELISNTEVYRYPCPYQTVHFSLGLVEEKCGSTGTLRDGTVMAIRYSLHKKLMPYDCAAWDVSAPNLSYLSQQLGGGVAEPV
jgi:hypothetical protein